MKIERKLNVTFDVDAEGDHGMSNDELRELLDDQLGAICLEIQDVIGNYPVFEVDNDTSEFSEPPNNTYSITIIVKRIDP